MTIILFHLMGAYYLNYLILHSLTIIILPYYIIETLNKIFMVILLTFKMIVFNYTIINFHPIKIL
jgi:hypothetical protein